MQSKHPFGFVTAITLAGALMGASAAHADILASYAFDGPSYASSDVDANSAAADAVLGSGAGGTIGTDWRGTHYDSPASVNPGTVADALTQGNYVGFTITPTAGNALNLTSFTYDQSTTWGAGTGAMVGAAVFTSVDGFATDGDAVYTYSQGMGYAGNAFVTYNVDLSGASYQGLSGPLEVRVYLFDGAGSPTSLVNLDNLVLNGSVVPVPEPASMALLGLSGALLISRRRKSA